MHVTINELIAPIFTAPYLLFAWRHDVELAI